MPPLLLTPNSTLYGNQPRHLWLLPTVCRRPSLRKEHKEGLKVSRTGLKEEFSVMFSTLASRHTSKYCPLAPLQETVVRGVETLRTIMEIGSLYAGSRLLQSLFPSRPPHPHPPRKQMADASLVVKGCRSVPGQRPAASVGVGRHCIIPPVWKPNQA